MIGPSSVAALVGLSALTPAASPAQPTTPDTTSTVSVTSRAVSGSLATLAAAREITCTISVDNAHVSHTSSWRVNVHSVVRCKYTSGGSGKAPVDRIVNDVYLYQEPIPYLGYHVVGHPSPKTTTGKYSNSNNAAANCPTLPNLFYGRGKASITFPAGYSPRTGKLDKTSDPKWISPSECTTPPIIIRTP